MSKPFVIRALYNMLGYEEGSPEDINIKTIYADSESPPAERVETHCLLFHRMNGSLELELAGDFDGTSACELLNVLSEKCDGADRVLVNTSRLKDIHSFGIDTFQNNLHRLKGKPIRLAFTGEKPTRIVPERKQFFWVFTSCSQVVTNIDVP